MNTKEQRLKLFSKIDLYPVISSEFCNGRPALYVLEQIAEGGAKIVQLREKNLSPSELYELALKYRKICSKYKMLLIMNDHTDIALAVNADGVHLGQDDMPMEEAIKIAPDLIIGNSTHSLSEALDAQARGADYINIGPIYATQTKSVPCPLLGIKTIESISPHLKIPFTVMGGIKEKHLPELIRKGARKIAMVTEITASENIKEKVFLLRKYFQA
ncbi:MAG: thiamine-phosphate diphosphorylase [Lentisphaerae bacterium GWF2_44_16]|nr:MAG: thiamine-phosphate diphosphorylase [Lentisphaerae bacterium GWF2_44_16]